MESVPDTISDLRDVPLTKSDFNHLHEHYGARKGGAHFCHTYEAVGVPAVTPSYRFAAQMDLDRYHEGGISILDWDDLIGEMIPDERSAHEIDQDQLAMSLDKG